MIQLSYTSDWFTPQVIWFDERFDEEPLEYSPYFRDYQYLSDEEALKMLEDEFVTDATKLLLR